MENNFKGTNGRWVSKNCYVMVDMKIICDSMNETIKHEESKSNAQLIADAGNVRQKINCSLVELLERFEKLVELTRFQEDNSDDGCGYLSCLEKAEEALNLNK